ncbi:MAG: hypothetical protein PV353_05430, partial [Bartonella sp.]|nr:hypothetical protein [Bartonella sp.]
KPLKALIHDPCSAERGTLYHAILAAFCTQIKNQNPTNMLEILLTIGRKEFDKLNLPPDIEIIWWLNLEYLSRFLIQT